MGQEQLFSFNWKATGHKLTAPWGVCQTVSQMKKVVYYLTQSICVQKNQALFKGYVLKNVVYGKIAQLRCRPWREFVWLGAILLLNSKDIPKFCIPSWIHHAIFEHACTHTTFLGVRGMIAFYTL